MVLHFLVFFLPFFFYNNMVKMLPQQLRIVEILRPHWPGQSIPLVVHEKDTVYTFCTFIILTGHCLMIAHLSFNFLGTSWPASTQSMMLPISWSTRAHFWVCCFPSCHSFMECAYLESTNIDYGDGIFSCQSSFLTSGWPRPRQNGKGRRWEKMARRAILSSYPCI